MRRIKDKIVFFISLLIGRFKKKKKSIWDL